MGTRSAAGGWAALVLTIGKIGGADADGRTVGYYTASVARGRDDYYTGRGRLPGSGLAPAPGRWARWGEVDADDFRQVVMDAVDPRTGSVLRGVRGAGGQGRPRRQVGRRGFRRRAISPPHVEGA